MPPTHRLAPRAPSSPALLATIISISLLLPALAILLLFLRKKKPKKEPEKEHHHHHRRAHGHYHGRPVRGKRRCHVKAHKMRGKKGRKAGVEGGEMHLGGGIPLGGEMPPGGEMPAFGVQDMGDLPPPVGDGVDGMGMGMGMGMEPGMVFGGLVPPGGSRRGRRETRRCFGR